MPTRSALTILKAGKDYTLTVKLGESSANATAITVSDWGETETSDISTH